MSKRATKPSTKAMTITPERILPDAVGAKLVGSIAPDPSSLVEQVTPESLRGINIERVVTLDPGTLIRGKYLGPGAALEVTDPVTGEARDVGTHRFEVRDGVVARVMDSHQLGRELPQYTGKRVRVIKLGLVDTRKGRRVNDFIVAPEVE